MIEALVEALKIYGIAGFCCALFAWLAFDMWASIKKMHKDAIDRDRIFAIKIEAKLDSLSGEVHETQSDVARVGGMAQANAMRKR